MDSKTALARTAPKGLAFIETSPESMAKRLKLMIVNGKKLNDDEAWALAQYSVATGLNPFVGECYNIPGVGPGPGVAGWRVKAHEQLEYEAQLTRTPLARFWIEPPGGETPSHEEAVFDTEKGDIAVKVTLHDSITKTAWEQDVLGATIRLMTEAKLPFEQAMAAAKELVGPEPTWFAVGVVKASENFGPDKWDRHERALKRAEKGAIRKRFPRIHLPEPAGFDESEVIDVEIREAPDQQEIPARASAPAAPAAESEHPIINGAGRPYTPNVLVQKLDQRSENYTGKPITEKQIGLIAMLLDKCFSGEGADLKRHALQMFLFDRESLKDVPASLLLAVLNDWLKPTKDSGGDYQPDPMAVREANLAYVEAIKAQGQMSLPIDGADQDDIPDFNSL